MRVSIVTWSLLILTTQSAFAQFDSKERIIVSYAKTASADTVAMKAAADNPEKAKIAAVELTKKTDDTFRILFGKKLLDHKLLAYQTNWSLIKTDLLKDPADPAVVDRVELFRVNFALASRGRTCTVVVNASKGLGALVKYAKAFDADLGQDFKELGPVPVTREVERAEYKFKSFREAKETGRTDAIACTKVHDTISVYIVEE